MFIFTGQFATAGQSKSLLNNPRGAFFINKGESLAVHGQDIMGTTNVLKYAFCLSEVPIHDNI